MVSDLNYVLFRGQHVELSSGTSVAVLSSKRLSQFSDFLEDYSLFLLHVRGAEVIDSSRQEFLSSKEPCSFLPEFLLEVPGLTRDKL